GHCQDRHYAVRGRAPAGSLRMVGRGIAKTIAGRWRRERSHLKTGSVSGSARSAITCDGQGELRGISIPLVATRFVYLLKGQAGLARRPRAGWGAAMAGPENKILENMPKRGTPKGAPN